MRTVLLAEDLTFSRLTIAQTIQSVEDCTIIEVENGEQAIEAIESNDTIDVIVADIMMPSPSGLELLKMVRTGQTSIDRDIPFIIVSGAIVDEVQDALEALDVSGAISKPATKSSLANVWAQVEADQQTGKSSIRQIAEYEAVEISGLLEPEAFERAKQSDITKDPAKLVTFLGAVPILEGLERRELDLLSERAHMIYYAGNVVVDGDVFGTAHLPLIVKGDAEFLQSSQLPDGEMVEHRVAQLEAGNALGTFNFMSLPDDYVHPKVRTTRPTEVVVLNFEDPDPNSKMSQIRVKIELTIGRILARRVTYADKAMAETLTQQLAETRIKRTAGGYVIMMFVLLAIYTLAVRIMLDLELKSAAWKISSVAMMLTFLMPIIIMLRSGPIKAVSLGLTFRGARTAAINALVMSSIFVGVLIGAKYLLVTFADTFQGLPIFALSQDFSRLTPAGENDWMYYAVNFGIYTLFVPVQEIIARCGIQSLLVEFLYGSDGRRAVIAILVSNFIFAAAHTHLNAGFALATFFGGLFFGWQFHRHRSIVGVSVAHFVVGGAALFALGLEDFLK